MATAQARSLARMLSTKGEHLKTLSTQQLEQLRANTAVLTDKGRVLWSQYKPRDAMQWLVFLGGGLLALSVISTVFMIVSGFLLMAAWCGLVMFAVTVTMCSFAAVFCGTALIFFSGTCAVMGTFVMSAAFGLYAAMYVFTRARDVGVRYLDSMQQSTGKLQYKLEGQATRDATAPLLDTTTTASAPAPSGAAAHGPAPSDTMPVSSYGAVLPDGSGVDQHSKPGVCAVKGTNTSSAVSAKTAAAAATGKPLHEQVHRQAVSTA